MAKKILVVDKSIAVHKFSQFTLEKEGYEVVLLTDGPTALQTAEREKPDLILAEQDLSGMKISSFCEEMKRSGPVKGIPILVLATSFAAGEEEALRRAGMSDAVKKPLDSSKLKEKIKHLLTSAPSEPIQDDEIKKIEELLGWSSPDISPVSTAAPAVEAPSPGPPQRREQARSVEVPQLDEQMVRKMVEEAVQKMAREIIERIAWEVVPSLAEKMIQEEINKLINTEK